MPLFIPPALMGIGATLARVGPAAAKGYRTLKGIRAARAASGAKMGYQKALGSSGTGLGTGTSGSGLQGLMARGAKRFPGATGSTELGTGVLLGGEGVGDIVTGTREGRLWSNCFRYRSTSFRYTISSKRFKTYRCTKNIKK